MRSFIMTIALVSLGLGCIRISDTSSREDAGIDAGQGNPVDAGTDAGPDAGIDASADAGPDAGLDAGIDAGPDAAVAVLTAIRDIQLAGNRRGDAVLVAHVVAGGKDALWATRFDPDGGNWSPQVTLAAYDRPADAGLALLGATVSLDPLGNAIALWSPPDAGNDSLGSAVNSGGTSWTAQAALQSGQTSLTGGPSVRVFSEGAGKFTAAYLRATVGGALLRASRFRSDAGWAQASDVLVPFDGGSLRALSGGADSTGTIHFAIAAGGSVFGARLEADGGWGPVVLLGQSAVAASYYYAPSDYGSEAQISVNAGGTAIAAWNSRDVEPGASDGGAGDAGVSDASVNSTWVSWYRPDAGWSAAERFFFPVDGWDRSRFWGVAIDDSARAEILAKGVYFYSAVRTTGPGNFGSAASVTTSSDVAPGTYCSLGLAPVGDGFLVCEGFTGGVYEAGVYAKRFVGSDGGWTWADGISGGGNGHEIFEAFSMSPFAPRIAMDETGRALVVFVGYAGFDAGVGALYSTRSTGASTWSTAERRF